MKNLYRYVISLGVSLGLSLIGCSGGGNSGNSTPPPQTKTTPTVSVTPSASTITTAQSLTVAVVVSGGSGNATPTGSVTLTSGGYTSSAVTLSNGSASISVPSGSLSTGNNTLSVKYTPDTASSPTYNSATGTNSISVTTPALITPTVTVTPSASTITTAQPLTVAVAVSGGSGNATPTGSVTLTSGSYTSSAVALSSGSASINVPAESFATGNDTLTVKYTPDSASSATYNSATGTGSVSVTAVSAYVLTVNSVTPSSGIAISVSPTDINGASSGTTAFTRSYNAGAAVTLTAPTSSGSYSFVSWSGCTSTIANLCNVTMNANTTVAATYNAPSITSITVSPDTATIGTQQQFTATVNGTGNFSTSVTWSLSCPSCGNLSAGTLSAAGLYNTPYPAPSSVVITATSTQNTSVSGSVTVSLAAPATATGPSLSVDVNTPNTPSENPHAISPLIYGVNAYVLDTASANIARPGLLRWGGDATSRYNYQNGWTNSANDWYFENQLGASGIFPSDIQNNTFSSFVMASNALGATTLGTMPVLGWVSNGSQFVCSFTKSAYPNQVSQNSNPAFDQYHTNCGAGYYADGATIPAGGANAGTVCNQANGCAILGSNTIAAITSIAEPAPDITAATTPAPGSVTSAWANGTWAGRWVDSAVSNSSLGNGASGKGVAIWDLDNEPTWWDAVHRDVHPVPFTYDEVTNNGIGTALAIKTADPTAQVSGPVIDYWWGYFYSKQDIEKGWSSGPCYQPWSNPTDREAHGGVPMIEYYLQQFNKYSQSYGIRLLDYVDIHAYFAPTYNGNSVAFTTAGDTQEQLARMNGTRVFWDPTYTDPNYPQPNYPTDAHYTASCSPPALAPQLVRTLRTWVNNDYPGTKTAIDEYNFGGLESVNGAVVQADILGIFGREGLDMGAFWPTTNYNQQIPGNYAFAMYRNYDLASDGAVFGDTYLYSTSTASGADAENQLAVYATQRSSDKAVTVMVINKTYGALTSTISLENFTSSSSTATVFQYSNANLNSIVSQPAVAITPPSGTGTTSTISSTFPAQSITLLVIPN